jgi:hypothetical protein
MKRTIFLFILLLFLASCSSITKSEFLQHRTMYRNWDHMKFSWFGYRHPTAKDVKEAKEQNWWGIKVPYVPGQ